MSGRVFKWVLQITPRQELELPRGAEIISVAEQANSPVLYAVVRDNEPHPVVHEIRIVGTGQTIDFDRGQFSFLGTIFIPPTGEMLHIWEKLA